LQRNLQRNLQRICRGITEKIEKKIAGEFRLSPASLIMLTTSFPKAGDHAKSNAPGSFCSERAFSSPDLSQLSALIHDANKRDNNRITHELKRPQV
jgi:hypothetical protein